MSSIPPVNVFQPNGTPNTSMSSPGSSTQKVNDVALGYFNSNEVRDAVSTISDNQNFIELEQLKKELKEVFSPSELLASEDSGQLLSNVSNLLAEQILQQSTTTSKTQDSDAVQVNIEESVTSSIRVWQVYTEKPPASNSLLESFSDERIVELMFALCSTNSNYSDLFKKAQGIKDLADLVERMNRPSSQLEISGDTPKSSANISGVGRSSSEDSVKSSNSQLKKAAETYRSDNENLTLSQANRRVASGDANEAISRLLDMFKEKKVVILGEGDHQEYALDAVITNPKFPENLALAGVKTVVAEHIYFEHVSKLQGLDCSEVAKHLTDTAFGKSGKAFNYLQFLRACAANNIDIIAADTKEIYRPTGLNKNTYNQTDRLEVLNDKVVKLHKENEGKGKMLIILGAAHTNHLNAEESRSQMEHNKPNYRTPGVTDIILDSQEFIVVTKRSDEEMSERIPLHSIREGMVFQVKI